jgi:hypothetical protein
VNYASDFELAFTKGGKIMSKKMLSLEDIESTMALDLPDRDLMSWLAILIVDGVHIVHSFNTEYEAEDFCLQAFAYNSTQNCMVTED